MPLVASGMKAGVSIGPWAVSIDARAGNARRGLRSRTSGAASPHARPHPVDGPKTAGIERSSARQREASTTAAAGHRLGLGDAEQRRARSGRRRRGCRRRAGARPSTVTTSGTGLSEWAVFGEPSGSSMWSAVAVVGGDQAGAAPGRAPPRRPRRGSASTASTAVDRRRDDAGVADHVGVGEVDDPEAVVVLAPCSHEGRGGRRGAHLRLVVVGRRRRAASRPGRAPRPPTPARGRR